MKTTLCTIALLLLALSLTTEAVQVQENDFTFSLEAVRKLQELTESSMTEKLNPRLRTSAGSVCADPALPMEFYALCQRKGATMSLSRLAGIPLDVCEICAFAACTGC